MADLTGRALDAAVAERVMGWRVQPNAWDSRSCDERTPRYDYGVVEADRGVRGGVPRFSTSHDAVATVRAEIERRGLRGHFVYALAKQFGFSFEIEPFDEIAVWIFLNATPEQQCRAALAAVGAHNA